MLREVHARNFLLFKDVSVAFHSGFNVITGETGAGKSMFVRLLRSLFGDYKAKEMIGPFEEGFWIEAVFDNDPEIVQVLLQSDIPVDDPMIIKIAGTADRFTARINGSVVSSKILKEFLPKTFEIHSQNAFQKLRTDSFHIEMVDHYAGSKLTSVFKEYSKHYKKYNELKALQRELPGNSAEMLRTLDFLNFQIQEIEEAALKKGEDVEVSNELKALSNYDYIRNKLSSVLAILDDSPEIPSVIDRIGDICGNLEDISDIEDTVENWLQTAMTAQDTLSDLSREVYSYLDSFEFDEERMVELDERMKVVESMKRKYGPELDDVFNNLEKFIQQKESIESKMERAETLDEEIAATVNILDKLDDQLFKIREESAAAIEKEVMEELEDLKMEKVRIAHESHQASDFQSMGRTFLHFTASTNPGAPFLPISKIASGGEMSRIFLAMEMVIQRVMDIPSVVFDEIDSGVGARLGDLIGKKISILSENGVQTFVITHLPQVAAFAQRHFKVGKLQEEEHTVSTIEVLDGSLRESELREMYGESLENI